METNLTKRPPEKITTLFFEKEFIKNYIYHRSLFMDSDELDCTNYAYSVINEDILNIYLLEYLHNNDLDKIKELHHSYMMASKKLDTISEKIELILEKDTFLSRSLMNKCNQFKDKFIQRAHVAIEKGKASLPTHDEILLGDEFDRFCSYVLEKSL